MPGSVRFSESAHLPPESDFGKWPGIYVHPGTFKSAADRPRSPEAWQRYRHRFVRLRAQIRKRTTDRPHVKRRWPIPFRSKH